MFIPQRTVYDLKFENPELKDLQMKVSACTVEEFNWMTSSSILQGQQALEAGDKLLAMFAEHIISWNVGQEVDGKEEIMPKTADSLKSLDQPFVIRIISSWQAAMVTIPNLSKPKSSSGGDSEELSLGLANGSQSQPSWPQ